MKRWNIFILLILIYLISLNSCKHVDKLAQTAADSDLIDRGTANMISLSARAYISASETMSPEEEYYIGRAVAANILATYKIWNGNQKLINYLNLICAAIVINSPQPNLFNGYHVVILDSNEINAFATSGGHIFVTRGLVNVVETEDALAGVIAHEIAHVQLKHGINSIRSSRMAHAHLLAATTGVGMVTGLDSNEMREALDESVGEIMQTMVNSGYSKDQEYEADIAAMYLMAYAGYEPSGLIEMLNELKKNYVSGSGFGKTHPSPTQRIYFAQRALKRLNVDDTRKDRQNRFDQVIR